MGLGFVLIIWAFLLAALGVPAAIVVLFVAHRTGGAARVKRVLRWIVIAAPLAAGYVGVAFVAYALWCSQVRGVDPGIGDGWNVPLGHGFSLSFIDVTDHAWIFPRNEVDGEALEAEITRVGQSGRYVYGLADSAFILDTERGTLRHFRRDGLPAALQAVGVAAPAMVPVGEFYDARRWGWPDVLAALILVIPAAMFAARSGWRAWVGPRRIRRIGSVPFQSAFPFD